GYRDRKSRQSRLLLVSLLENFCALYDQSPDRNRRLFFVICRQLHSMGLIDMEDFVDEMSSVRTSYKRAFRELVLQAMQATRDDFHIEHPTSTPILGHAEVPPQSVGTPNSELVLARRQLHMHFEHRSYSNGMGGHLGSDGRSAHRGTAPPSAFQDLLDFHSSRFQDDFVQISLLGRGAFGEVFEVRNKLDSVHYAIKRVKLDGPRYGRERGGEKLEKILREVKLQARFAHPNVVRYFAAWLEHAAAVSTQKSRKTRTMWGMDDFSTGDSADIDASSGEEDDDESKSLAEGTVEENDSEDDDGENGGSDSLPGGDSNGMMDHSPIIVSPARELTLFIQMELCMFTLQDWLKARNDRFVKVKKTDGEEAAWRTVDEDANLGIFRDICNGLHYVHSEGVIHRDVKVRHEDIGDPRCGSRHSGRWKIGDFGLVTEDSSEAEQPEAEAEPSTQKDGKRVAFSTANVGTAAYASPEQLNPKSVGGAYTTKADMYSAGIILFELFYPVETRMERAMVFKGLREGVLPDEFVKRWPKEVSNRTSHAR
ncbi:kinase-like domain-containing protein, partial [Cladochytrium replicatum]